MIADVFSYREDNRIYTDVNLEAAFNVLILSYKLYRFRCLFTTWKLYDTGQLPTKTFLGLKDPLRKKLILN